MVERRRTDPARDPQPLPSEDHARKGYIYGTSDAKEADKA